MVSLHWIPSVFPRQEKFAGQKCINLSSIWKAMSWKESSDDTEKPLIFVFDLSYSIIFLLKIVHF